VTGSCRISCQHVMCECLCGLQEMAAYKGGGKKPAAKAPPKPAPKPVEDEDDDDDEEDEEEEDESD